ncbi:hypothetical protein SUGI_0277040 [Cryptomeria japonica]|uniref:uncharacterized protein LOC131077431 n=1 Tax=Cryptomeria japonica TaxID=3369 RepID=UPI0024089C0C|nr:uncharacterized protein LOC131077431 [Cryptomeria japonica]GLJ16357.1 hypothetical protein SUGI_0277040 [Cryptomeria japonica]
MSCTIPSIRPKVFPHYDSKNSLTSSSSSSSITESKNANICLAKPGGDSTSNSNSNSNSNCNCNSNSTIVKKRRTRRGRPHNSYSKAIASFYTIYPRLFSDEGDVCPLVKIEPRSPAEKTELLQELPALLSKLREAEEELPLILSNFNHVESGSPLPSPSSLLTVEDSPGFDHETEKSFLEVSDFDGGMDTILGGPGPPCVEIHSPERRHADLVDSRAYDSAIRGLRRNVDGLRNGHARFRSKLKMGKDKLFSLDWLTREDPCHSLSLKLDYQQVLSAWSGQGSLYIDDGQCPNSEDEQDCEVENVDFGLVPDMSFWRGVEECNMNFMQSSYMIEDGSRRVEKNAGVREARVLRYKEKRQTRLFSKKIRYEVRKLNAEKRPRMKGRFVKR